jgi:hypothetical protein
VEEGSCKTWVEGGGDPNLKISAEVSGSGMGDGKSCGSLGLGQAEIESEAGEVFDAGSGAECGGIIAIDCDGS